MKIFLKRLGLFLLLPLVLFLGLMIGYVVCDPFKVIRNYDSFSITDINLNRDYISTEYFLRNYNEQQYNSFVFGSSRSIGFDRYTWQKYIGEDKNIYFFDAYNETIWGIVKKLQLIDSLKLNISNVLILVDADPHYFSADNNHYSHIDVRHPALLGNSIEQRFYFQRKHFEAYLQPRFLISYYGSMLGIDNKYTRIHRPEMRIETEYPSNHLYTPDQEQRIKSDSTYFDSPIFFERSGKEIPAPQSIYDSQIEILKQMKSILDKHQSQYVVIINPLYNQTKLNRNDLEKLNDILGADRIFDFSGKNSLSDSKYNFYEKFHFRPQVGDSIMKTIYEKVYLY